VGARAAAHGQPSGAGGKSAGAAQAEQLDALALQEAKQRLLLQLQQARSRAHKTPALISEARTALLQEI